MPRLNTPLAGPHLIRKSPERAEEIHNAQNELIQLLARAIVRKIKSSSGAALFIGKATSRSSPP